MGAKELTTGVDGFGETRVDDGGVPSDVTVGGLPDEVAAFDESGDEDK